MLLVHPLQQEAHRSYHLNAQYIYTLYIFIYFGKRPFWLATFLLHDYETTQEVCVIGAEVDDAVFGR